jgi:Arc/MetJ-type ribon-helix-helix transcriptional regulator
MAEPTAQCLRVTFTATRADTGRFVIACEPLAAESAPVLPGSDPAASDAAVAASAPTELEGFTVEEVDYAITWLIQHHPTTGSFARLSHFIDQAIKEWQAERHTQEINTEQSRAAEQQRAEHQRLEEERHQIEEAKALLPSECV